MKTKNRSLVIVILVIVSLAAGFLTGTLVDIPKTDNTQLVGTIGRVQNYKNVKITQEDIELKNELLVDSLLLRAISVYFNYYYVSAVSQGEKIQYALKELENQEPYREYAGVLLEDFARYGTFLGNARTDLLLAIAIVKNPGEVHPVMIRNTIGQANNVISQISYRKQSVLDLIDNLSSYLSQQGKETNATLASVHTVLTMDQIAAAMAMNDKMVLQYFEKKKLFTDEIQGSFSSDLQGIIVADMGRLDLIVRDKTFLGMSEVERVPIIEDAALIGSRFLLNAPALQNFLQSMNDLGYIHKNTQTLDNMQGLGLFIRNAEGVLGIVMDKDILSLKESYGNAEKLGFLNMNQLGSFLNNAAELGMVTGLNPNWPPKVF